MNAVKKILLTLLLFSVSAIAQDAKPASNETQSADPLERYPEYFKEELNQSKDAGDSRFFNEFLQMMIYLIGIIAFMVFFMWILKRLMTVKIEQSNRNSEIRIVESRALSQKTTLYIIEIYDQNFAIAESLNGITSIGELSHKRITPSKPQSFDTHMTS